MKFFAGRIFFWKKMWCKQHNYDLCKWMNTEERHSTKNFHDSEDSNFV